MRGILVWLRPTVVGRGAALGVSDEDAPKTPRERRTTQRARRSLRVPVDEVPRRSVADLGQTPPGKGDASAAVPPPPGAQPTPGMSDLSAFLDDEEGLEDEPTIVQEPPSERLGGGPADRGRDPTVGDRVERSGPWPIGSSPGGPAHDVVVRGTIPVTGRSAESVEFDGHDAPATVQDFPAVGVTASAPRARRDTPDFDEALGDIVLEVDLEEAEEGTAVDTWAASPGTSAVKPPPAPPPVQKAGRPPDREGPNGVSSEETERDDLTIPRIENHGASAPHGGERPGSTLVGGPAPEVPGDGNSSTGQGDTPIFGDNEDTLERTRDVDDDVKAALAFASGVPPAPDVTPNGAPGAGASDPTRPTTAARHDGDVGAAGAAAPSGGGLEEDGEEEIELVVGDVAESLLVEQAEAESSADAVVAAEVPGRDGPQPPQVPIVGESTPAAPVAATPPEPPSAKGEAVVAGAPGAAGDAETVVAGAPGRTGDAQAVEAPTESPVDPPPQPTKPGAGRTSGRSDPGTKAPALGAPARRRRRPWFEDFFNDDYLRTVRQPLPAQVSMQCDFIEGQLGLQRGATILDVGCGLGLHAVELTARGYLVVGLDLSLPMLSRAADEAQDRELKINFLHGDMREMGFDGAFDAILCWGTTFGYFDDESNRLVIERLYRALKPMGLLLLEMVNRDHVLRSQPNLVWFEGDGCVCMEETKINYITSRLEVKRTVILDDGRQRENFYSIRLYSLHELGQLLHNQGFRVAQVSGQEAAPGVFFGADSPRILILAERRIGSGQSVRPTREIKSEPAPSPPDARRSVPTGASDNGPGRRAVADGAEPPPPPPPAEGSPAENNPPNGVAAGGVEVTAPEIELVDAEFDSTDLDLDRLEPDPADGSGSSD